MSIRGDFESFCAAAHEADERGSGSVTDYEQHLENLVEFCRHHVAQGRADEIADCFVAVGKGEILAPYETSMFCMHTLRLKSVVEDLDDYHRALEEGRRKSDFGLYLADLREAFDQEWADRDLWRFYGRK